MKNTSKPSKEIIVDGVAIVPINVTQDKFFNEFVDWLESMGWLYAGKIEKGEDYGKI